MIRTIFHKMMVIFIAVLLICFILTGILFNTALNRYVIGQRTEVLDEYGANSICIAGFWKTGLILLLRLFSNA